jgi:hypothetical protein
MDHLAEYQHGTSGEWESTITELNFACGGVSYKQSPKAVTSPKVVAPITTVHAELLL